MTQKLLNRFGLLLGTIALPLVAADTGPFYVSGSIINSQGDMRQMTQNPLGYGAEVGFRFTPAEFGLDLVGHVGYLAATQDKKLATTNQSTVKAGHFGVGLSYPVAKLPMAVEVGLVMHSWDVGNLYSPTGGKGETSWKMGVRTVVSYDITPKWGANLGYTFSEYVAGINPSYVSIGASYRF